MALRPFQNRLPQVDASAFVDESAQLIGDVVVGAGSSIWHNAVARGDVNKILIGNKTSIQDLSCLHVALDYPLVIGNNVTVGHGVTLHACTVRDSCLIGMSATILDGAEVGEWCIVGAGSLITPGKIFPSGSLVLGAPAKVVRPLTDIERQMIAKNSEDYVILSRMYLEK